MIIGGSTIKTVAPVSTLTIVPFSAPGPAGPEGPTGPSGSGVVVVVDSVRPVAPADKTVWINTAG